MNGKAPDNYQRIVPTVAQPKIVSRMSLGRSVLPVLAIFVSITMIYLGLTFAALAVQSSVRAYVAGEGIWSASQRDAVLMLELYGQTHDPEYLEKFRSSIAVPMGDHAARVELQRPDYEHSRAVQGFLQGRNHPDDIPGMIRLFRCCSHLPHLERVIHYWTLGDEHVSRLIGLAQQIHEEIDSSAPSRQRINALLEQVHAVNDSVRPLEAAFTETLGEAARWISAVLFYITSGIVLLLIALGARISWRILASIRATEEQYRVLLNTASDALIVVDEESGKVVEANRRAEQMTGQPLAALIGSAYIGIFTDEQTRPRQATDLMSTQFRKLRTGAGNREVPVEVNNSMTAWGGRPAQLAIVRDISERIRTEHELRIASNAMAHMAEGVMITDAGYRTVFVNRAYTVITGFEAADVLGSVPRYETHAADQPGLLRHVLKTLRRTGRWQGELWSRRKTGELYPQSLSVCSVSNEDGRITHYVGLFQDNSAFREYERRLKHLARHDSLTQLPNRMMFEEISTETLARAAAEQWQVALLFIDLDGFKAVNDAHGHVAGDYLLKVVGERLRSCTREGDVVARMGGDEFTILMENSTLNDAAWFAHRVLDVLTESICFDGNDFAVSASIGISVAPGHADDVASLLARADMAMYEAKLRGKNNVQIFSADMAATVSSRLRLSVDLRRAIDRHELELYYQPCIDLLGGEIAGVEALLRWRHPDLGLVAPSIFIPIAEETGLIGQITEWVLREACQQAVSWAQRGVNCPGVAVNLSPRSFWDSDFPARIAAIVDDTGWQRDRICLEITESAIMQRDNAEEFVRALAEMGFDLAIDDFGIGHSSLLSLRRFPVRYLKIDRAFTAGIPADSRNLAMVRTIMALARDLGLSVIAEGIEVQAQHDCLAAQECRFGQGYLYARPMPSQQMESLLRSGRVHVGLEALSTHA